MSHAKYSAFVFLWPHYTSICVCSVGFTVIIDDQYAPLTDKITAALTELSGAKPRFLVNTHWHGDHAGGNEFLLLDLP